MVQLWSIGHSNLALDAFIGLLREHRIEALADVRRFPASRAFPHFNTEPLRAALAKHHIHYHWFEDLGGRRKASETGVAQSDSRNGGLINASFRHYADYMMSEEFRWALERLLDLAAHRRTAMMCSEAVYWRCHRRLIADHLLTRSITTLHIMGHKERPHTLTPGGVIVGDHVEYPPPLFGQPAPSEPAGL
jgi:uncharacterized protein (DUF488 family)